MKAICLWQPWAHLVARGHKLIENRPWKPPQALLDGEEFAIHAGKHWDKSSLEKIREIHGSVPGKEDVHFGAIVGVARVIAVVDSANLNSQILALDNWPDGHAKWFFGPYGWVLGDVRLVHPAIPCRGYQKLWNLTNEQEIEVAKRSDADLFVASLWEEIQRKKENK